MTPTSAPTAETPAAGMVFTHDTLPQRVLFGSGRAADHLTAEVARLGASAVMVIASTRDTALATRLTASIEVALAYHDVAQHVPIEIAKKARAAAENYSVDLIVCLGGGSATGLAKAIAMASGQPIIAIPTTYAGSEATAVWGLTENGRKTTGHDPRVLPTTVIYDAALTVSLPVELSVASGLNALAHCVDSMWAPQTDPINKALSGEGIHALAAGLPAVVADPAGLRGREETLYGAYLAAVGFASAGSGMHHKICHVLGGAYNLPHAQTHAVVLPYVLAFNAPAAPDAAARIAAGLGTTDAVAGLAQLRATLQAPTALRDYGFKESEIDAAAALILPSIPASNPRPVTEADVRRLLHAAWAGTPVVAKGITP